MGRASSNKKVARAAGIGGGRVRRRRTPWGYYAVVGLIVILGIAATVASRDHRLAVLKTNGDFPPTVGTVWNEGYAVYTCDGGKGGVPGFLAPISTKAPDPQGITTRQAGIINIHPTVKQAAGHNATLGKFASAVGMKLNAAELQVPGGKLYQDGFSCKGQPGHVYVKQFAYAGDNVGQVYDGAKGQLGRLDPRNVPLQDQAVLVIAFVPAGDRSHIPAPPSYVTTALQKLAASNSSSSSTASTAPAVTVPPVTTKK